MFRRRPWERRRPTRSAPRAWRICAPWTPKPSPPRPSWLASRPSALDGKVLPKQLVDTFDAGEQAPVPILAGFNSGEIRSLRILAPQPPASAAAYETEIRARYGDLADDFLKLYPSDNPPRACCWRRANALYG